MAYNRHPVWSFRYSAYSWNRWISCIQGFRNILKIQIFIVGSLSTCGLALLIATPFALGSAIFMTEISPKFGEKFYRPVIQIFAGIPSVVYGWVGLTVLVPFIRDMFHRQVGHSILAAGIVLAIMIFPTITSVSADAIRSVPKDYRMGAYGMGSTRWQTIFLPNIMHISMHR